MMAAEVRCGISPVPVLSYITTPATTRPFDMELA
jgi:hypothetical protein